MCLALETGSYPKRLRFTVSACVDYGIGVKVLTHDAFRNPKTFSGPFYDYRGRLKWDGANLVVTPELALQEVVAGRGSFSAYLGMHLEIPPSVQTCSMKEFIPDELYCYFLMEDCQAYTSEHAVVKAATFPIFPDTSCSPIHKLARINRSYLRRGNALSTWKSTTPFSTVIKEAPCV